jgi:bacterial/archaeal transporter family protein
VANGCATAELEDAVSGYNWLLPASGYVLIVGIIGVTTKLALRDIGWQDLLVWTAIVYAAIAALLVLLGSGGLPGGTGGAWAVATGICASTGLICSFVALQGTDASRVVPYMSAYPVVTIILAAVFLSEHVTPMRVGGSLLVVGGLVLLSL